VIFLLGTPGIITLSNELIVSKDVTVSGPGPAGLTLTAGTRVFHITNGVTAVISGLTISGARLAAQNPFAGPEPTGAGIYNDSSTLTVSNCLITGNSAPYGGGIASSGPLTVISSTIKSNSTVYGGLCNSGGAGAGIFSTAPLTVIKSMITNNFSAGGCGSLLGGVGIFSTTNLTVLDSTVSGNSESGGGGFGVGMYVGGNGIVSNCIVSANIGAIPSGFIGGGIFALGSLAIEASTFNGNIASSGAGIWSHSTLSISDSIIQSNSAVYQSFTNFQGGGIYVGGNGTLRNCIITGNTAGSGGGICNTGILTFADSTISNNSGSGIANYGTSTISNCTVRANTGSSGGGIYNIGPLTVTASTIDGNFAQVGGGVWNSSTAQITVSTMSGNSVPQGQTTNTGGGICNQGGTVEIGTSTIYRNVAGTGGGIANNAALIINACTFSGNLATYAGSSVYNTGGPARIADTILSTDITFDNISGGIISAGYNLSSDDGDGSLTNATDRINLDPMLGPLQNNGGITLTCALAKGSPAVGWGKRNCFTSLSLNADQRGLLRPGNVTLPLAPAGDGSDIGAFELQLPGAPLLTRPTHLRNGAFQFGLGTEPGANYEVDYSPDLVNWVPWVTFSGTGTLINVTDQSASSPKRFYRVVVSTQ
jgi:hypothetical protein